MKCLITVMCFNKQNKHNYKHNPHTNIIVTEMKVAVLVRPNDNNNNNNNNNNTTQLVETSRQLNTKTRIK